MANSPLLGGTRPASTRREGTGVDRLGPSDLSDSGSDLMGADGAVDTDGIGLDGEDIRRERGAGADIGDANLDSDSDMGGTGERAEAGRDTVHDDAPDISPDRIVGGDPAEDEEGLDDLDAVAAMADDEDPAAVEREAEGAADPDDLDDLDDDARA
ncbi:hypothetical protein [Aquabacterium sp. J223]|uniref:hypothetical protein n=1 Tax=Aquabacterium sp. J223 TaxID=2898431 RepID=UPI0021ADC6CC|nr:hypothetical protein [Aquabacterium sp. J223]UUX96208.1 hypothetical protein LRS07_02425 [Aquabacterium sp. J223]